MAEQEAYSLRQAPTSSSTYFPSRRQETGGPGPMEHSYEDAEPTLSLGYKHLQKFSLSQKIGHYTNGSSAPNLVLRTQVRNDSPSTKKGSRRGSDVVENL